MMLKQRFEDSTAVVLTKQENVVIACEIYKERCGLGLRGETYVDPVVEFLNKPENVDLVRTICEEFPRALGWLARMVLLKDVRDRCQERLQAAQRWRVALDPDDSSLLDESYPAISLEPRSIAAKQWSFYLSMDATKVPFWFEHGIVYSEQGGQPQSMPQQLQVMVNQLEDEFVKLGFNTKKGRGHSWFAHTDRPYKQYALGDDPPLLDGIFGGKLADAIRDEFVQLFVDWSKRLEYLNSLL
jgi:hypothetical protein